MNSYSLHSKELQLTDVISHFGSNISFEYSPSLVKYFKNSFPGYYIFKVNAELVDKVYFQDFFKSREYIDACRQGTFSPKWESYIKERCYGDYYILDARDYNGQILKYFTNNVSHNFHIEYFGNVFGLYHDIGHVYLDHMYTKGTFKHRDEMDASIFAVIKLLQLKIFNEKIYGEK